MNLYIDSDEESDFDTDGEADRVMGGKKKKKEKKSRRGRRAPRRMTKSQRKEVKEAEVAAKAKVETITESMQEDEENPEDSEDDFEDRHRSISAKRGQSTETRNFHNSTCPALNNSLSSHDEEGDDLSACSYKMPAFGTMLGLTPQRKEVMPGRQGTGYSSDSSVVRKRIELAKQKKKEQRKLENKNKQKKKSKSTKKGKPVETLSKEFSPAHGTNPYLRRVSHDSFDDYEFDEVDEISVRSSRSHMTRLYSTGAYAFQDDESSSKSKRRSRSSSQRRSKKNKKKKSHKNKKSSKSSVSCSDDDIYGDDNVHNYLNNDSFSSSAKEKLEVTERMLELDSCFQDVDKQAEAVTKKTYDQRFEEVEKFEAMLFEERERLQKERASVAFERESLDLQLQEEVERNEVLSLKVGYLEKQLQANETLGKANTAELSAELHDLKVNFEAQKKALLFQLTEKGKEISDLKSRETLGTLNHSDHSSQDSGTGAKSRERLQGELLQARSKLMETQHLLEQQTSELEALHEALICHQDGTALAKLQDDLNESKKHANELKQELAKQRNGNAIKLKEKDETIEFLLSELAKLKQEQSMNSSVHSMSSLRNGRANIGMTGFLANHPGLSLQPRDSGVDPETVEASVHRRGSISSYFSASNRN
jgi:hypothetical protein